jgi:hypothetical protein
MVSFRVMLDTVYGSSPVDDQRAAAISIVAFVRKGPKSETRFDRIQNLQISTSSFRDFNPYVSTLRILEVD